MALIYIDVVADYTTAEEDGEVEGGTVEYLPSFPVQDPVGNVVVAQVPIVAQIDPATGQATKRLLATDSDDLASTFTYQVTEKVLGATPRTRTRTIEVPKNTPGGVLYLADVADAVGAPVWTYVTQAAFNTHVEGTAAENVHPGYLTELPGAANDWPNHQRFLSGVPHVDVSGHIAAEGSVNAGIIAAGAVIQAAGGGTLYFSDASYLPTLPKADDGTVPALVHFEDLDGLTILAPHVTIADQQVYDFDADHGCLFAFSRCKNISLPRGLRVEFPRLTAPFVEQHGPCAFEFREGCEGIRLDYEQDGGVAGVRPRRLPTDPLTWRSRDIKVRIKATYVVYPYNAVWSGDNADVQIDADTCGRNFFLYGCEDVKVRVRSKNQQKGSLIKAYAGYGCSDVEVFYFDSETTSSPTAIMCMRVGWGDATPATHRNIKIRLDVKNIDPSWGPSVAFEKYDDAGNPDTVGRGHVLDGFELSGYSEQVVAGTNTLNMGAGAFDTPDVIKRFKLKDLDMLGPSASVNLGADFGLVLHGRAIVENVHSDGAILINTGVSAVRKIVFIGCTAPSFTNLPTDEWRHLYIGCNATDEDVQARHANQVFVDTMIGDVYHDTHLRGGPQSFSASRLVSGSLVGATQIFRVKLSPFATGYFRLIYDLVLDQSVLGPTRSETVGIKSFVAGMSSAGAWTSILAVANEVAERTVNTPSVLTVSLVNGDDTGGLVAVSATNYNVANSRGAFKLEFVTIGPPGAGYPISVRPL